MFKGLDSPVIGEGYRQYNVYIITLRLLGAENKQKCCKSQGKIISFEDFPRVRGVNG